MTMYSPVASDICAICGFKSRISDPKSEPPYVHLSCVLRASITKPLQSLLYTPADLSQKVMLFSQGDRVVLDFTNALEWIKQKYKDRNGLVGTVTCGVSTNTDSRRLTVKLDNGIEMNVKTTYVKKLDR